MACPYKTWTHEYELSYTVYKVFFCVYQISALFAVISESQKKDFN